MADKSINVAHLIATNFFGGPEKQIVEHLKLMNKKTATGIAISFVENETENEFIRKANEAGIKTIEIFTRNPLDVNATRTLVRKLRENRINLLCTHGYKSCVLGLIAARLTSIKCLAFSRGYTTENLKVKFYEWLERQTLKKMDGVVSVSGGQEKKLNSLGVYPKKSWVVHNAVNLPESTGSLSEQKAKKLYSDFQIPYGSRFAVAAGRFSPEKGHRFLINAAALVKKELGNIYFIFCGDGECKEDLENLARQENVLDICRFPGFRQDIPDIFRQMEFLVLPSLTEGLPNVVLEAFSLSKAVIATDVGGVSELVKDNNNGFLIPPKNPVQMAEKIIQLMLSDTIRVEMGKNGFNRVKAEFSFGIQLRKLLDIYYSALN